MALPDLHLTHGQFCLGRDVRAQGRLSSGNLILIPGFTGVRALLSLKEPLEIPDCQFSGFVAVLHEPAATAFAVAAFMA